MPSSLLLDVVSSNGIGLLSGAGTVSTVVAADDAGEGARLACAVCPSRSRRCANLEASDGPFAMLKGSWRGRSDGQEGEGGQQEGELGQHCEGAGENGQELEVAGVN